ncbi:MAG: hypothetical protein AB7V18_19165 [Pyrinomonadaceae bacterium]
MKDRLKKETETEWDDEHRSKVNTYYGFVLGALILGVTFGMILPQIMEDGQFNRDEMGFLVVLIVLALTASVPTRIKQLISILLRRKNGHGGDHAQ